VSVSITDAAAEIVRLINSSPRSPTQAEIEAILDKAVPSVAPPATPLVAQIRETAERLHEAFNVLGKVQPSDRAGEEAAQAKIDELQDRLEELGEQIPDPPKAVADLVAWAEIAHAGADVRRDGTMAEATSGDVFDRPAARLIEAVLQFGGSHSGTASMSAHAVLYQEWRALIQAHLREFGHVDETGMTPDEVKAEEERLAASMATINAMADKILAEPVRAWTDLLPCAEIAFWLQWAGVDPHGPDASGQMDAGPMSDGEAIDQALAKVLKGIFALAGVGQFAEAHHG
jgi:hypothetical protein